MVSGNAVAYWLRNMAEESDLLKAGLWRIINSEDVVGEDGKVSKRGASYFTKMATYKTIHEITKNIVEKMMHANMGANPFFGKQTNNLINGDVNLTQVNVYKNEKEKQKKIKEISSKARTIFEEIQELEKKACKENRTSDGGGRIQEAQRV
jgi:hypothetical protein